jgi:biopolymer transport protein ExbD
MHRRTAREKREHARKHPPEADPEFQIAPMIDILLVLLVFFMSISSTEVLQVNKDIRLPVADSAKNPKENPGQVTVNMMWNLINNTGTVEVKGEKYATPADIVPILQNAVRANPNTRVLVRADREVKYDYMRTLLQAVGDAGISNITFSTVDKESAEVEE